MLADFRPGKTELGLKLFELQADLKEMAIIDMETQVVGIIDADTPVVLYPEELDAFEETYGSE